MLVYDACMYSERLQILVSPEQRRRLEAEARRQGVSMSAVVRDVIDKQYGVVTREERIRAFEGIQAMQGGKFIAPEELDRIVEEERERLSNPRGAHEGA